MERWTPVMPSGAGLYGAASFKSGKARRQSCSKTFDQVRDQPGMP